MSIEIVVPEMGESVIEATVRAWLKKEGDFVEAGEALVELDSSWRRAGCESRRRVGLDQ